MGGLPALGVGAVGGGGFVVTAFMRSSGKRELSGPMNRATTNETAAAGFSRQLRLPPGLAGGQRA